MAFSLIKSLFKGGARKKKKSFPGDFSKEDIQIISEALPFTMTNRERMHSMLQAMRHVIRNQIEGDIVECGVWKGGNIFAGIRVAQEFNELRDFWLYDTFSGMPKPDGEKDVSRTGEAASQTYETMKTEDGSSWCCASLEEVKNNIRKTGYPDERLHYVQGLVEETIPREIPSKISILRLDTDWYSSTQHELEHLYPRLVSGGILIIDDYGFWKGSRKAVDEYFEKNKIKMFLSRVDSSARIAVKP